MAGGEIKGGEGSWQRHNRWYQINGGMPFQSTIEPGHLVLMILSRIGVLDASFSSACSSQVIFLVQMAKRVIFIW